MKTAMQELILKLPNEFIFDNPNIILEALEKEKNQIIDFTNEWFKDYLEGLDNYKTPEEYYNQTYNIEN